MKIFVISQKWEKYINDLFRGDKILIPIKDNIIVVKLL